MITALWRQYLEQSETCNLFIYLFFFFLIFQNQSAVGDVIQQIKIKSLNMNKCKVLNGDLGWGGLMVSQGKFSLG